MKNCDISKFNTKEEIETEIEKLQKELDKGDEYSDLVLSIIRHKIEKLKQKEECLKEDYTSEDLLKVLFENNFEETEENLNILKEEIELGTTVILSTNESREDLSDFDFKNILESNGFAGTDENVSKAKVLIENGHLLLSESGFFRKLRNKHKAKKRMKKLWKEGKAGPQVKKELEKESIAEVLPTTSSDIEGDKNGN